MSGTEEDKKRRIELLANAVVCFDLCMSPFCSNELVKQGVSSDECRGLSWEISAILKEYLYENADFNIVEALLKRFKEEKESAE